MAKSLDQVNTERAMQEGKGASFSSEDAEIATRAGIKLISQNGGIDMIRSAINQSKDPAQVIGQFLAQLMGQLAEQLQQQYDVDPRVFLAKGGFLDNILDYIEKKLGYPEEFSDQIYGQVLEVVKAAAASPAPNNVMDPEAAAEPQGMTPGVA